MCVAETHMHILMHDMSCHLLAHALQPQLAHLDSTSTKQDKPSAAMRSTVMAAFALMMACGLLMLSTTCWAGFTGNLDSPVGVESTIGQNPRVRVRLG